MCIISKMHPCMLSDLCYILPSYVFLLSNIFNMPRSLFNTPPDLPKRGQNAQSLFGQ